MNCIRKLIGSDELKVIDEHTADHMQAKTNLKEIL